MPPKLNTMSAPASVRRSVAVISSGLSPRYWHQASVRPRLRRMEINCARCLSWRLPRMISSPMIMAPIGIVLLLQNCLLRRDRLIAQLRQAGQAIVDESKSAVNRHQKPDQGNQPEERDHDTQQEQFAPVAPDERLHFPAGRVLVERIIAKHPLIEVAEQQDWQYRPQQREKPQRQRQQNQQRQPG